MCLFVRLSDILSGLYQIAEHIIQLLSPSSILIEYISIECCWASNGTTLSEMMMSGGK